MAKQWSASTVVVYRAYEMLVTLSPFLLTEALENYTPILFNTGAVGSLDLCFIQYWITSSKRFPWGKGICILLPCIVHQTAYWATQIQNIPYCWKDFLPPSITWRKTYLPQWSEMWCLRGGVGYASGPLCARKCFTVLLWHILTTPQLQYWWSPPIGLGII